MVLAEQNRSVVAERFADVATYPQLVTQPGLHRLHEGAPRTRKGCREAGNDAFEFKQRLFVEDDIVEVIGLDVAGLEAVSGRTQWEFRIVFLARKALFFGGG